MQLNCIFLLMGENDLLRIAGVSGDLSPDIGLDSQNVEVSSSYRFTRSLCKRVQSSFLISKERFITTQRNYADNLLFFAFSAKIVP